MKDYPLERTFHVCLSTGLITLIDAATSTAGQIGVFRWLSTTHSALIHRARAVWSTVTPFTNAQEVGMDLVVARAFTAESATVGAVTYSFAANDGKIWTKQNAPSATAPSFFVSGTAVLTAGTHTLDGAPLDRCQMVELAAAGTPYRGTMAVDFNPTASNRPPLRLDANEGLILRNTILMGAAGTARVVFAIDLTEQAV
jgi:hypothetical protein